jgi:hypothetical protein
VAVPGGTLPLARRVLGADRTVGRTLALVAFVVVVAVLSHRAWLRLNVPGHPDGIQWAMQDFRDAIYFPVVAFLGGDNPYDHSTYLRTHPVGQVFAPYAPAVLLLYLPFGLLPFEAAELLYFVLTLALTLVLARMALRLNGLAAGVVPTLVAGTLLLASRPGHQNLLLGQCTAHVVIGCFLALRFGAERPLVGGVGLALALLKPHFGVPLAILMLFRREQRAVALGAGVLALASAVPLALLVVGAGGVGPFAQTLIANVMALDANPTGNATSGWARIDAPYLLARLVGRAPSGGVELALGVAVLAVAGLALRRLSARGDARARVLAACVACLAVVLSVYHQAYDALLLVWPLAALATAGTRAALPPRVIGLLMVLLAVPAVNYLATWSAIGRIGITGDAWQLVTAVNAAALAIAFTTALVLTFREPA